MLLAACCLLNVGWCVLFVVWCLVAGVCSVLCVLFGVLVLSAVC